MTTVSTLSLNGIWQIRACSPLDESRPSRLEGTVPGVVHADLLALGLVDDPLYRRNEIEQQWVGETGWEYSRQFEVPVIAFERERVTLCCDGLDTLADVYINEHHVASTDNMFIAWRWDIKPLLHAGTNAIRVVFHPLGPEMDRRSAAYWHNIDGNGHAAWHPTRRNFVRKSHTHGGWDWGPCFLTPGIWRDIRVEAYDQPRLLAVTHVQTHARRTVTLTATAIFEAAARRGGTVTVEIAGASGAAAYDVGATRVPVTVKVAKPELWWPNGYGQQPLYELVTTVACGDERQVHTQRIGFRELALVREADAHGESFYFRVNGVPIFAKGANWIPSDSFDCRLTDDQLRWELGSAAAVHHNIVRVWGGGLYERDAFYSLCDELGLLVWHDFMFACNLYPVNAEFLGSVREEVRQNVRRLQHHPCIALWCGNNECEQCLGWRSGSPEGKLRERTYTAEYDELYTQTILPIVAAEDPTRTFWPSSPSNGVRRYGDPQDETLGDVHFWGVWHGDQPFEAYLKVRPRFSSEFGFQSFAAPELLDKYTLPEDRNITSSVLEHFQRSGAGNQKILNHMSRHFRVPVGWENTLYLSQVLQAASIKVACEHWRRLKPRNMGTIIWQLNDIWPAASWSSLDYEGRWKIMHYFARHFYAPLLVSTVTDDAGHVEIWGTSDRVAPRDGELTVWLQVFGGETLFEEKHAVRLRKLESRRLATFALADVPAAASRPESVVLRVRLTCGDELSENAHLFAPAKALSLAAPRLEASLKQDRRGRVTLTLRSDTFTPYVWVRHGSVHGTWDDNGMHLFAGEPRRLTFAPREDFSFDALEAALQVHDLYSAGF